MRSLLVLVLLLAAGATEAKRSFRSQLGGSKRFPSSGAAPAAPDALRLSLGTAPSGTVAASTGQTLTFTRASGATCWRSGQTMTTLANNIACQLENKLQLEGASTNLAIHSEDLDDGPTWGQNSVTVTANTGTYADPYGTSKADILATSASGGYLEYSPAMLLSGSSMAVSIFARSTTGTQALNITIRDSTAGIVRCTGGGTATTTWQRFYCRMTSGVNGNNNKMRIYPGTTGGTGTIVAFGAQIEFLDAPSSYIKTTTVSASRSVTSLTVPTAGLPLSSGVFVVDFEPAWDLAPPDNALSYMFMSWTGSANGLSFYLQATNIGMEVKGSAGVFNAIATTASITADTSAKYRYEWDSPATSAWRIYKDGVLKGSGTHTLTFSSQGTGLIGNNTTPARYAWGWIGPVYCFSTTVSGCH